MTIEEKIFEIVARKMKCDVTSIDTEDSLKGDLGADSIDTVEIIFDIEEEYNIAVPDELAEMINTISDAVRVITKLVDAN
ncbi:acyl carrier protein [bacterium]|nr:acyl carrier protein [bacterium]